VTYIVGFRQPGINAILADTRVSWRHDGLVEGRDGDLKTGLLFRGCVFGSTGFDVVPIREFVTSFKESIHGHTDTILGFWHRFRHFVEHYPFPGKKQKFQLLLSHRGLGEPRFALLDSLSGLDETEIPHSYYLLALGSGGDVLNEDLQNMYTPRLKQLQQYLLHTENLDREIVHTISPYFLCLWLCEKSLTFEKPFLASHGVGGVFHFVWQSEAFDAPQKPAVYLFSTADRTSRIIRSWVYRVAAVQGGLYVESHAPAESASGRGVVAKLASFDTAARYDVAMHPENELRAMVEAELASLPFYFFCGLGFADPSDRKGFGFVVSTKGKREDLFDDEGRITPYLAARIAENFEGGC
jgi:hypothetical protein